MEKKYKLSKHLSLKGTNPVILLNKITGLEFEVSEELISFLQLFKKPRMLELNSYESKRWGSENELRRLIDFLLKEKILIFKDYDEIQDSYSVIENMNPLIKKSPTFFNSPYIMLPENMQNINTGDIIICGIPFDLASTGIPGSRFAPHSIRLEFSENFDYSENLFTRKFDGWNSVENKKLLVNSRIRDCGDIFSIVGEDFEKLFKRINIVSKMLFKKKVIPVFIGGDHSISHPILAGLKHIFKKQVGLIHIDAHHDLGDTIKNIPHSHGNVFRKCHDDGLLKEHLQFGVRGYSDLPNVKNRVTYFTSDEIKLNRYEARLNPHENLPYHLSLDIDVIDPTIVPGTGTPVIGGISVEELKKLLDIIIRKYNVVSFDFVELNPLIDTSKITTKIGCDIIVSVLDMLNKKRN